MVNLNEIAEQKIVTTNKSHPSLFYYTYKSVTKRKQRRVWKIVDYFLRTKVAI